MRAFHIATFAAALSPVIASCASGGSTPDDTSPVFDVGGAGGTGGDQSAGGHSHGGSAGLGGSSGGIGGGASGSGGSGAGQGGGAGDSGGGHAGSDGGSGGSSGASGANGGVGGDASGAAGMSGAGGDGGSAGAGGSSAGAGGSAGGAGGGGGAGGDAGTGNGGGAGKGGAAGGPITESTLVVVAASSTSGAAAIARFTTTEGWQTGSISFDAIGRPAIASRGANALIAARMAGGTTVAWGSWDGVTFDGPTTVPSSSAVDGPSLATSGMSAALGFLGTETPSGSIYASEFSGGAFPAAVAMGPSANLPFGKSAAKLVRVGGVTYGIYAGENEGLYYTTDDGTGFTASTPIQGAGAKAFIAPGATVDPKNLAPSVFFARNTDNEICLTSFSAGSWSAPSCIPNALTDRTPAVVITATRTVVAWHGYQGQGIFAATSTGSSWSNVITIEAGTDPSSAPAITAGLGSADAEIVWSRAGVLRHARLTGDVPQVANVGASGVGEVDATLLAP